MPTRSFTFAAASQGGWTVRSQNTVYGQDLEKAIAIRVLPGFVVPSDAIWTLRGITSNIRYVEQAEKTALVAKQAGLDRPGATYAALIPIRKSAAWWGLTQDHRRQIFEEQSKHIAIGMRYLPAIARRLHHCRDISESEPFDFLTWFEYAPEQEAQFDRMLVELRSSPEWAYIEREIDIRLVRGDV